MGGHKYMVFVPYPLLILYSTWKNKYSSLSRQVISNIVLILARFGYLFCIDNALFTFLKIIYIPKRKVICYMFIFTNKNKNHYFIILF
jgi:hypothetical protein